MDFQFFADLVQQSGNASHLLVALIAYGTYLLAKKVLALLGSINKSLAAIQGRIANTVIASTKITNEHGQLLHSIRTQNTAILAAAKKAAAHGH